jgi:hypothetical protein
MKQSFIFFSLLLIIAACKDTNPNHELNKFKEFVNDFDKNTQKEFKKEDSQFEKAIEAIRLSSIDKFTKQELYVLNNIKFTDKFIQLKKDNPFGECLNCNHTEDPNTWQ